MWSSDPSILGDISPISLGGTFAIQLFYHLCVAYSGYWTSCCSTVSLTVLPVLSCFLPYAFHHKGYYLLVFSTFSSIVIL